MNEVVRELRLLVSDPTWTLMRGSCLDRLRELPDDSVDAVVTDPPYGLSDISPAQVVEIMGRWASGDDEFLPTGRGFNNQSWDVFVPPPAVWRECYRVLKPGGHLVAFSGTRTHDLMGVSIRMAGFEIRDRIYDFTGDAVPAPASWLYASGMPKGNRLDKQVESTVLSGKANSVACKSTELSGGGESYTTTQPNNGIMSGVKTTSERKLWEASTPEGKRWKGWSTALKPSVEPITVARKPLGESTVAKNVMKWSTGALNVDATRVPYPEGDPARAATYSHREGYQTTGMAYGVQKKGEQTLKVNGQEIGRHPTNALFDDASVGFLESEKPGIGKAFHTFHYSPKATKSERPKVESTDGSVVQHPTVKPVGVMEWLVDLVTPVGGVVLDPFAGSGTTLQAAVQCGFDVVGCELSEDYCALIEQRMAGVTVGREREVAVALEDGEGADGDLDGDRGDSAVVDTVDGQDVAPASLF